MTKNKQPKKDNSGYILLHRRLQDHWLMQDMKRFGCWVDLLLMANHADKKVFFSTEIVLCKRGEIITSLQKLSDRWSETRNTTRGFIETLKTDTMIHTKTTHRYTQITICNYDTYQVSGNTSKNTCSPDDSRMTRRTLTTNNTLKELKEKSGDSPLKISLPFTSTTFEKKWSDWVQFRKEKKKPVTTTQMQEVLKDLAKYPEDFAIDILSKGIKNGWQGLIFDSTQKDYERYLQNVSTTGSVDQSKVYRRPDDFI
jgi:DNA replication protein DnaD